VQFYAQAFQPGDRRGFGGTVGAGAGKAEAARATLERAANFNAFSPTYAFVRNKALAMLKGS